MLENIINKVDEYHKMFNKLKEEDNDCYQRIRLYLNGCLGVSTKYKNEFGDEITYYGLPKRDIVNLYIELSDLIKKDSKYEQVAHGLYNRMENIVKSNGGKNERSV